MRKESPRVDEANIASMAACLMGKIDRVGFIAAHAKLADPNSTLLREKWFPVAECALEHFNFLARPNKEESWLRPAFGTKPISYQIQHPPITELVKNLPKTSTGLRNCILTICSRYILERRHR